MTINVENSFRDTVESPGVEALLQMLSESGSELSISGARGSFKSFILAEILRKTGRRLLIIAPSQTDAETVYNDIHFFLKNPIIFSDKQPGVEALPEQAVTFYPCLDTLPYDRVMPQIEVTVERMQALSKLLSTDIRCVVTSAKATVRRVIPKQVLKNEQELIMSGEEIDREGFLDRLISWGYSKVGIVEDPGDFAVRGNIIDIYIPSYKGPARIELFGDLVESIRIFDPLTQRSRKELGELICFPVTETIYRRETKRRAAEVITEICSDLDIEFSRRKDLVEKIKQEVYFSDLFEFTPAFYEKMDSLFDYLSEDMIVVNLNPAEIKDVMNEYYADIRARYKKNTEEKNICLPPEMIYMNEEEHGAALASRRKINLRELELTGAAGESHVQYKVGMNDKLRKLLLDSSVNKKDIFKEHIITDDPREDIEHKLMGGGVLKPLIDILAKGISEKRGVFLTARTSGQAERLCELIAEYNILCTRIEDAGSIRHQSRDDNRVYILKGGLSGGFLCSGAGVMIITEEEIFGERVKRSVKGRSKLDHFLSSLSDLKADDFIVHVDHGIGIYKGLKNIPVEGIPHDFLMIEFAGGDLLYLPVDRLNLVMKYSGLEETAPKLDKLGGVSWVKVKERARKSIEIMARELLEIDARRKLDNGYAFSRGGHYYSEFEASFEYEETPDQTAAINDVIEDMEKDRPMDRLICGDVGFGKTEVAIRAAFKAVMDGKQVAVLVPTTILAQQHFKTFTDRFKGYPFVIEMLSRFKTASEQKVIKKELKEGKVNIIIGTHILLSKDIGFLDLGLIVIDEEQRFGVRHKEKLKHIKATVDVLTLSATPIPRTLHMALSGIRDISIINTPPLDRLSIRTIVTKFNDEILQEGMARELKRDGQVFFVHNRVQSIFDIAAHIRGLLPNAKIAVAHGQMHEKELEKIMVEFVGRSYDILVCTAIIESGLDISAANTIFINRADSFGLAQLYQLRGRVGRGKVRAYSYLLIPSKEDITKDAVKRLNALMELSELGSGYKIAMHDLEIRGAGNLLGSDQSGNIMAVGFDLYTQLIEQVVGEMRGIEKEVHIEPEINMNVPALIPDEYIDEVNQRLVIYQRVSSMRALDGFEDLEEELIDRYGSFPDEVKNLFELMRLRFLMKKMLITSLEYVRGEAVLNFDPRTRFDLTKLLEAAKGEPKRYRFSGEWRFHIKTSAVEKIGIIRELRQMLGSLN